MALTRPPVTAADGTFSTTGATAWAAGFGVAGATSGGIPYFSSATTENTSALLASNAVVIGGGSGNPPSTLGALGTTGWVLTSAGAGQPPAFAALPAATVTWDAIGAAAGSATTANGTNNIVYNTAPTADAKVAWTFGETSAATGGTGARIPNQILLQLATLAASTQSPLQVVSRGLIVFSISPTTRQIVLGDTNSNSCGSAAVPIIASNSNTGIYLSDSGFDWVGFAQQGLEMARFISTDNVNNQLWGLNANNSTVGFVTDFRKSRGTVVSPSVITTGDILGQVRGSGYVGATNTYREAARIEFDSTGTISDATSGIGGIIKFSTTLAGTDTAVQEGFRLLGGSAPILQPPTNGLTSLGTNAVGWKSLFLDYTNTGTVGSVTINKPSGRVNLAAAGTTLTLTNSLITAASHVFLNSDGAPGNVVAVQFYAVPGAGSATINAVPAVTNQTAIDFLVVNAD